MRIGNTVSDTSKIVQYTSATYYSSGTRVWNTLGNGSLYATTGTIETFTISSWTADGDISPYAYKTNITIATTLSTNTIVELINDNAISFANYGFAIGSISSQTATIYAVEQPTSSTTLKIRIQ